MGKRRGGSRHSNSLRRHIEAAGNSYSTVEELVNHLRSSYPHLYARHKLHPFTKQVEKLVAMVSATSSADDTPIVTTKRMKIDVTNNGGGVCSSSSLASANFSGGGSGSDEEASTSDDGVYSETLMNEDSELGDKSCSKIFNKNDGNCNGSGKDRAMFKDFGGISGVIEELRMKVLVPLYEPRLYLRLGVKPMTGILLHGPPGCGKTKLAEAIANEAGVSFHKRCATQLVSGVSGESEENIRELFSKAHREAPSIVFIDEIDAIASKRENLQRGMENRIVTQLLGSMDESHVPVNGDDDDDDDTRGAGYVLVIGATNRPDALDSALRRRFDREFALGLPDEAARIQILSVLIQNLRVEGALNVQMIARSTPGFSGADLKSLTREAAELTIQRHAHMKLSKDGLEFLKQRWSDEEMDNLCITMADFEDAVNIVQPCSTREGFSAIPNVTWEDVGGFHSIKEQFDLNIVRRIKSPEVYKELGADFATGFLLHGPPGCGKTLIAKAVANAAGVNFIHIKGPELISKYLGESEMAVRTLFSRARACAPCIIFFDEVDALTARRGRDGGGVDRVVNQLLIELDGSEQRKDVYVIGATNRLGVMDEALLRPGRFEEHIRVPLPSPDERGMILTALARNKPIDAEVDLTAIGRDSRCDNFSGADLFGLMKRAVTAAVNDRSCSLPRRINNAHFTSALQNTLPSPSPSVLHEQRQDYELSVTHAQCRRRRRREQLSQDGKRSPDEI